MQVGVVVAVVEIASEAYVPKAVGCTDTVVDSVTVAAVVEEQPAASLAFVSGKH